MSDVGLVARQTRYEVLATVRNVPAMVFTFAFPLMFLIVFGTLNHNNTIDSRSGLGYMQFFVPGVVGFSVLSACYTGLGMRVPLLRDAGVLKRMRGTPLPAWTYVIAITFASAFVAFVLAGLILAIGFVVFGVEMHASAVPGFLLFLVLGATCMCALGLAIASVIPTAEAAAPIVQFSIWPVLFISGVFFPLDNAPAWLDTLAAVFPVRPMTDGLQRAFDPSVSSFDAAGLAVLVAWTLAAATVAIRRFRWDPVRKA